MIRRFAAIVLALAASAACASSSRAAERPGAPLWSLGPLGQFVNQEIHGLDTSAGRIVAAGMWDPDGPGGYTWVRAYRPNGRLDSAFGQAGVVDFADDRRAVVGAIVQSDGRILVAESGGLAYPVQSELLRRLTPDGKPDPSFGTSGHVELDLDVDGWLKGVALQPDGRIVVVGTGAGGSVIVSRYRADGTPDAAFGSAGVREIAGGPYTEPTVYPQPGGSLILAAAREDRGPVIGRLSPTGEVDASFGAGGLAPVELGRPAWVDRTATYQADVAVAVLPDGRIRVGIPVRAAHEHVYRSSLVGLTADGHPDPRFGRHGLALGPRPALPAGSNGETPAAVVVDERGGILVASKVWAGERNEGSHDHSVIRRFSARGTPDRSFGGRGAAVEFSPVKAPYPFIELRMALLGEDRVVVAQNGIDGKYGHTHDTTLRALSAAYDDTAPSMTVVAGCRGIRIRVRDTSALDALVVRGAGRRLRRTSAKRLRFRPPHGIRRLSIRATDAAGNTTRSRTTLPRC